MSNSTRRDFILRSATQAAGLGPRTSSATLRAHPMQADRCCLTIKNPSFAHEGNRDVTQNHNPYCNCLQWSSSYISLTRSTNDGRVVLR